MVTTWIRYIRREATQLLELLPTFGVFPPKLPQVCPYTIPGKIKGWEAEKLCCDLFEKHLKKLHDECQDWTVLYFRGLRYGAVADGGLGAEAAVWQSDIDLAVICLNSKTGTGPAGYLHESINLIYIPNNSSTITVNN